MRRLHDTLEKLLDDKEALQRRLSEELGMYFDLQLLTTGAKSLNLRWTPGLSHIVHVNSRDAKILSDLEEAKPISASKSTRSFQLPVVPHFSALIVRIGHISAHALIKQNFKSGLKSLDVSVNFVSS